MAELIAEHYHKESFDQFVKVIKNEIEDLDEDDHPTLKLIIVDSPDLRKTVKKSSSLDPPFLKLNALCDGSTVLAVATPKQTDVSLILFLSSEYKFINRFPFSLKLWTKIVAGLL